MTAHDSSDNKQNQNKSNSKKPEIRINLRPNSRNQQFSQSSKKSQPNPQPNQEENPFARPKSELPNIREQMNSAKENQASQSTAPEPASEQVSPVQQTNQNRQDPMPQVSEPNAIPQNPSPQASVPTNQSSSHVSEEIDREIANLQVQLKTSQAEVEDWKNKALRAAADNQNLVKQHELDVIQSTKTTKKSTARVILGFLNTLNLSFAYAPQSQDEKVNSFINTLKTSFEGLIKDLKNNKIELIVPQTGDEFDPQIMSIINADNIEDESPKVKQVMSIGLRVEDQVVQPAMVTV